MARFPFGSKDEDDGAEQPGGSAPARRGAGHERYPGAERQSQ